MVTKSFLEAAEEAARAAGRLLKSSMASSLSISYKGEVDLVTDFDKKAQALIFDYLHSFFPKHDYLAEEDLCEDQASEFKWIIDPIDGTTNFAHRFPAFCVSIALEHEEKLVLGVIFDPIRNEMFTALKGEGAYLNGEPIAVSAIDELNHSLLVTGFPYDIRTSRINNLDHFCHFAQRAQAVRRLGSAALDLCYLACGRFDGFWELKLQPWDVAAGTVIVREAGGLVTDFGGEVFDVYGSEILASNHRIHDQMREVLKLGLRPQTGKNSPSEDNSPQKSDEREGI